MEVPKPQSHRGELVNKYLWVGADICKHSWGIESQVLQGYRLVKITPQLRIKKKKKTTKNKTKQNKTKHRNNKVSVSWRRSPVLLLRGFGKQLGQTGWISECKPSWDLLFHLKRKDWLRKKNSQASHETRVRLLHQPHHGGSLECACGAWKREPGGEHSQPVSAWTAGGTQGTHRACFPERLLALGWWAFPRLEVAAGDLAALRRE